MDSPKNPCFESCAAGEVNDCVDWFASEAKLKLESTLNGTSVFDAGVEVIDPLSFVLGSVAKLRPLSRKETESALLVDDDGGLVKLNFDALKLFVVLRDEPKSGAPVNLSVSVDWYEVK